MSTVLVPSTFLSQVLTRKLSAFAGISLLVYDYSLTFQLEVTHIWNEPWTLVKSLFLINRYGNLIGQTFITLEESGYLSHEFSRFCPAFQFFTSNFAVISGESIRLFVVIRACAVSSCRRSTTLAIITIYILYIVGYLVLGIHLVLTVNASQFDYLDEIGVCIALVVANTWEIWFISLFIDGFVFLFVLFALYRFNMEFGGASPSPLSRLLMRDSIVFYFATLFYDVFCMICWTAFGRDPRNGLDVLIAVPLITVIGQRIVLNIREYQRQPESTFDISWEVNRQIAAAGLAEERRIGSFELVGIGMPVA